MQLSPRFFHWCVRPSWLTRIYIHDILKRHADFLNKTVVDFGCGIGVNCPLFPPANYLGVDTDTRRIAYARHLYPDYTFRSLQGNFLPTPNASVDYILVVAVLHHIPAVELPAYLREFKRVLKPHGKILVLEPCFFKNTYFNNWFMSVMDRGRYIQTEDGYLSLFSSHNYKTEVLSRFKKLMFYNELHFHAVPQHG